jgi:hypothetical protein
VSIRQAEFCLCFPRRTPFRGSRTLQVIGGSGVSGGSGTVARVVQTSSRHQIYVCARLRVGVRVNVPGTPQRSIVHSGTRDLQGRSLICLLNTSLRRGDESARNLPPQQTGLNPSPFRAVPVPADIFAK